MFMRHRIPSSGMRSCFENGMLLYAIVVVIVVGF